MVSPEVLIVRSSSNVGVSMAEEASMMWCTVWEEDLVVLFCGSNSCN